MTLLFTILIVIVCILLALIILVQNPKGGGLGSAFGGGGNANMFGGVKKTTDFLDKSTWGLSIALFVLVLGMNMFTGTGSQESPESELNEQIENTSPVLPNQPAQQPAGDADMPEPVEE